MSDLEVHKNKKNKKDGKGGGNKNPNTTGNNYDNEISHPQQPTEEVVQSLDGEELFLDLHPMTS